MRVAIADDGAIFRQGVAALLRETGHEVAEASDGGQLLRQVSRDQPDLAILDVRMPPGEEGGLETAAALRATHPAIGLLLLSHYAEARYAARLLEVDTRGIGYLIKDRVSDVHSLQDTLRRIRAGEAVIEPEVVARLIGVRRAAGEDPLQSLTERELSVLRCMAEGRSNAGIAKELFLVSKTVEKHVSNVFDKLGLDSEDADGHRRVMAVLTYLRLRGLSQC